MASVQTNTSPRVVDVIIIGAGISGLSAAYELKHHNVSNIAVLEARDRVGGRTYTIQNDNCTYVDLGGAYVGVTQKHLHRMLKDLGLKIYKVNEKENLLIHDFNHKIHQKFLPSDDFKIGNWIENLDLANFFRKLDEIGSTINIKEPWNSPNAKELDQTTYGEFVEKFCWTKRAKRFARFFININVCCEAYEGSLLWFAWYVGQCGSIKRIVSTTGGGQESKVHGGTQQISERIADRVGRDKVHLNDPAYQIVYGKSINELLKYLSPNESAIIRNLTSSSEKYSLVRTLSSQLYIAKKIIIAMPPALQNKLHFDPPLPTMRNQLIQRMPMGAVIKCTIYYKKRFWADLGLCGSFILCGNDPESCPFIFTLDDTKPDGTKPALMGFILADRARILQETSKKQREQMIARSLSKALNSKEALNSVHYEEYSFMSDQYVGGCYTGIAPPGFLTNYGAFLRKPIEDSIFLAGTETATEWSGYMNGAIEAGERAAREVLVSFKKLNSDLIWKEEPDSPDYPHHEFPVTFFDKHAPSIGCLMKGTALVGFLAITALGYAAHSGRFNLPMKFCK